MYLALIPQFLDPTQGRTTAQGFTLGAIQITVSMIVNALIVVAAGTIAGFLTTHPAWTKWQRRITGSLLGAVAIMLATEVPQAARP
jgi:threonine/homoserine/homoserine lactone efflux protein